MTHEKWSPAIVGIGGTSRIGSSSERALRAALAHAETLGARTRVFSGPEIAFPAYAPDPNCTGAAAAELIGALRQADGVILASPGYHGSISGLLKNALDYIEDMREDERVYLENRAVGLIVSASGIQAIGSTLNAMRSVVHALRGWPTPLGVGVYTGGNAAMQTDATDLDAQLRCVAEQVVGFAKAHYASQAAAT